MGAAVAQTVPNAAWSLLAPRSVPTVEWSGNGTYVLLTTNSAVEVLNGKTMQVLWSRTSTGAQPTFASTYGLSDQAHMTPDSGFVWIRSAAGPTYTKVATSNGLSVTSHVFSDWTQDYILQPVGKELLAYRIDLSGSTYTYTYRAYDGTTFHLNASGTLTHSASSGLSSLTIPTGVSGTNDLAFFFDVSVNTKTGAITSYHPGVNQEAWTVGIDPSGGLLQAVESLSGGTYTPIGTQRLLSTGAVSWTSNTFAYPAPLGPTPPLGFMATPSGGGNSIAVASFGTGIAAFDWLTGTPLWTSPISAAAYSYSNKAISAQTGALLLTQGTAGFDVATMDTYLVSGTGLAAPSQIQAILSGVANVEPIPNGVIADGNHNYLALHNYKAGAQTWLQTGNGGPVHPTASPAGDMAAIVLSDRVRVVSTVDGSTIGDYAGSFVGSFWAGETGLFAVAADDSAQLLTVSGGGLSLLRAYPSGSFHVGHAVTSDGGFAVGYDGATLKTFNLTTGSTTPAVSPYAKYATGWDDFFKLVPTTDARLAALEQTASGADFGIYHVAGGLGLDTTFNYTAPFATTATTWLRGDISPDLKVAAYFVSNGPNAGGTTPQSELQIVRLSDGLVLSTIDNVFSYIGSLKFSTDRSILYASLGGSSPSRSLTVDTTGSQDVQAIDVPAWMTGMTATSPIASGLSTKLTVNLSAPAGVRGVKVNLTATNGLTVPASVFVAAGLSTASINIAMPIVSADTSYQITGSITGLPESFTVTVLDTAPVINTIAIVPTTIQAGTSGTGTVNLTGLAPAGGITVTLTSSQPSVTIPASVTVAAGAQSATFPISTVSSTTQIAETIKGTTGTKSYSKSFYVSPTQVTSLVFDQSPITGGDAVTATVTIGAPAPAGGFLVKFNSTASAVFPASVTIPAGATTIEVDGNTTPVMATANSTIKATMGTLSASASLSVIPPKILAVQFAQHTVVAGSSVAVNVLFNGATAAGSSLALHSNTPRLTTPATFSAVGGSSIQTFSLATTAGADISAVLTVSFAGTSGTDTVKIVPGN